MIREERDSLLEVTDQQKKKIGFLENQVKADQEEKEKLALKAEQLENEKNEIKRKMEESQRETDGLRQDFEQLSNCGFLGN